MAKRQPARASIVHPLDAEVVQDDSPDPEGVTAVQSEDVIVGADHPPDPISNSQPAADAGEAGLAIQSRFGTCRRCQSVAVKSVREFNRMINDGNLFLWHAIECGNCTQRRVFKEITPLPKG